MEPSRPEPLAAAEVVRAAERVGIETAHHFGLPLARRSWRGPTGTWDGTGRGSSLEFHDHRLYQHGDDPRHINWPAYARTDALTMKVYREEVAPLLDLVLDASASMRLHPGKWRRSLETFHFASAAAARSGAAVHTHAIDAETPESLAPALERVRLRSGSLRLVISDLLFPGSPESWLRPLRARGGQALILAPHGAEESDPDWEGLLELVDCESGDRRERAFDEGARRLYRAAYQRHFEAWRDAARRHAIPMARLSDAGTLPEALLGEPLRMGAVVPTP